MFAPEFYVYVSTRACADPVRTVILCAPDACARTREDVSAFARTSGWMDEVEHDGGVLIAPVVADGWHNAPADLARDAYLTMRRSLRAPSCMSIPGRAGGLWAWEPLIDLVGYSEGAAHAAQVLVAHPSFAAAAILVDGFATDLSAGDEPSDHWFVANPSPAYHALNREVPVAAWLMGSACDESFVTYLRGCGAPEWALRVSPELGGCGPELAHRAMGEFLTHVMRWKNSPDGELSWRGSREEFFLGDRFEHDCVEVGLNSYHYAVHLPAGMTREEAAGLAVVFSIHGRGEPTWLFSDKNGWEDLADELREFMVVLPDSPYNLWVADRDAEVLGLIIDKLAETYGCDRTRVYVTGFSNGAAYTCQQATTRPWLFAAASPWNCPPEEAIVSSGLGQYLYSSFAQDEGYEMPFFVIAGDSDDKGLPDRSCDLPTVLPLNRCDEQSEAIWDGSFCYLPERGYREGDRITTRVFSNAYGDVRVGVTQVRDMPHGAIADEARAAWEFMRRFRRLLGAKYVKEVER